MRSSSSVGILNLNYKKTNYPIIPKINNIKSKIKYKKDNNIINTILSFKTIFNSNNKTKSNLLSSENHINKLEIILSNINNNNAFLTRKNNIKNKISHSLSNKIVKTNSQNNLLYSDINFDKNNTIKKLNLKTSKSFKKLNILENLKLKINKSNKRNKDFNLFYDKQNFLLIKPFNTINEQIKKDINNIIISKRSSISTKFFNSDKKEKLDKINNKEKEIDNIVNNYMNKNNYNKDININYIDEHKIITGLDDNLRKKIREMYLKNKQFFNSINGRIGYPYLINNNNLMNNFFKKNYKEYKNNILTQKIFV